MWANHGFDLEFSGGWRLQEGPGSPGRPGRTGFWGQWPVASGGGKCSVHCPALECVDFWWWARAGCPDDDLHRGTRGLRILLSTK